MQVAIVEIKAHCPEPGATSARMLELGATHQGRDHQVDTYFAVPHGRLKLRQGGIETNLIHYRRDDHAGPKESQVLLHSPSDAPSLRAALSAALDVRVVVDKQRDIFWAGNVKLHLDDVAGLGTFVEIEAIDRDGSHSRAELHDRCRQWLNDLGIEPSLLVTHSYSDLLLARNEMRAGDAGDP
ncbi:class IV adenylate cyclase [Pseudonocardia parietis]|uniref:Adenylyl cyclase CyaB n=1 Tax=Pseudonocardia parietis TaxID=570936 RepID=A0ABS4VT27_9PSEU|nr:class IV adenylate cyclase [Pseudonocardia parietis]MBP2367072.1 putative adenylyl cyclase CyaB [Pseudonocardia parietis]